MTLASVGAGRMFTTGGSSFLSPISEPKGQLVTAGEEKVKLHENVPFGIANPDIMLLAVGSQDCLAPEGKSTYLGCRWGDGTGGLEVTARLSFGI